VPQSHINEVGNPRWVWARNPLAPGFDRLAVHPLTFEKIISLGSNAKMGEFWGLVHGNSGPMPIGFSPVQTGGIKEPLSIFQGLKRPLHHVTGVADAQVYVYVTSPESSFEFRSSVHGNVVIPVPKPIDSVFTTFVSYAPEHVDEAVGNMEQKSASTFSGVVLFWSGQSPPRTICVFRLTLPQDTLKGCCHEELF
jgi:hypothetical protein